MEIKVYLKNVYGKELIYPDCSTAQKLLALTHKATFNKEDLRVIKALGYNITVSNPTLDLGE